VALKQSMLIETDASGAPVVEIPIDDVAPAATNVRKDFGDIGALAASIAEYGLLEPILVQGVRAPYTIVAGERRWRACRIAGVTSIRATVLSVGDKGRVLLSAVENLQRKNLDAIEEGELFRDLQKFLTVRKIAELASRSAAYVNISLRLLSLPPAVQEQMRAGTLTRQHGIELLQQPEERREVVAAEAEELHITAQELRSVRDKSRDSTSELSAPSPFASTGGSTRGEGGSDKQVILRKLYDVQVQIVELSGLSAKESTAKAAALRESVIDTLDWIKGMVDPLHAETYAETRRR
jgi:ParB family transcriptional regulator, chromosome partitioning protein